MIDLIPSDGSSELCVMFIVIHLSQTLHSKLSVCKYFFLHSSDLKHQMFCDREIVIANYLGKGRYCQTYLVGALVNHLSIKLLKPVGGMSKNIKNAFGVICPSFNEEILSSSGETHTIAKFFFRRRIVVLKKTVTSTCPSHT